MLVPKAAVRYYLQHYLTLTEPRSGLGLSPLSSLFVSGLSASGQARRSSLWALSVLLIGAMAYLPSAARADALKGQVIAVADGDTVTVLDADRQRHKIRLAGIDAPESRQAYGQRARSSLRDLLDGRQVQVSYDKTDRYGRLVGKIELEGRDINLEQLRRGLAWHYKKYEAEQSPEDRQLYAQAQEQAQAARLGLWRDPAAQAPWDYRQQKRQAEAP